jgi:hypothetical protein
MINGKISEFHLDRSVAVFSMAGTLASKYSSYRDSIPRIYLYENYSFEYVYSSFLKLHPIKSLFGINKDIIISMCFNPYFSQFYSRIKDDYKIVSDAQKKMLYNGFLRHYSLKSTKLLFESDETLIEKDIQEIYVQNSAYNKCNELIDILNLN